MTTAANSSAIAVLPLAQRERGEHAMTRDTLVVRRMAAQCVASGEQIREIPRRAQTELRSLGLAFACKSVTTRLESSQTKTCMQYEGFVKLTV